MAGKVEEQAATEPRAVPDLVPWRVAGWVFRDGECVAIERQCDASSIARGTE
jgi:hypothetical protein